MKECTFAVIKNAEILNKKTGSVAYRDIEFYRNTRTGKMMFSGRSCSQTKPVYWLAKNCEVRELEGYDFTIKIA